ncbi:MAG: hypothetical protein KGI50_00200 [Patescibacteria group bacterium]|nr:hypothetical protein [Patescibacteria group bacterium]MDE2438217.1 hypothetical protein [Patescibacteria group bacterium]
MEEKNDSHKTGARSWVNQNPVLVVLFAFFVFIMFIALVGIASKTNLNTEPVSTTESTQNSQCSGNIKSEVQAVDFKQLDKNSDSFTGKIAKFTGQILQIEESGGQGVIRLAVTKDSYGWSSSDVVYVEYATTTSAVKDDVVTIYGPLTGSKTYTSQANFTITIPSMTGCIIQKGAGKSVSSTSQTTAPEPQTTQTTTQPSTPTQQPVSEAPKSWHVTYTYGSATTVNTPPFALQGEKQRIDYTCSVPDSSYSVNSFTGVIRSVSSYQMGIIANDVTCPASNSTYQYSLPPGQYYLDLNSLNTSYTITVEDYY